VLLHKLSRWRPCLAPSPAIACRGLAWGGQMQDAVNAHLQSLKQFPPRQKGGSLRMAGD
jgi:hypothetical protein